MTEETAQKLDYALKYADLGWRVIWAHWPIGTGADAKCSCGVSVPDESGKETHAVGKHPGREWQLHATTNKDCLRAWFAQKPDANVSIVTGAESGIFVLDVDPRSGGEDTLRDFERKHGELPKGPTFITGGDGWHMPFKHPGGYIATKSNIGPGLDIRGNGGQIIAPPSRHASGRFYEVDPNFPLTLPVPEAPAWLMALVSANSVNADDPNNGRARFNIQEALNGVSQGSRDQTIFRLACKMRDEDIPIDMALDWIRRAAENCTPSFPLKLAEDKVHAAYKKYTPRVDWNREALRRPEPPRPSSRDWVKPYSIGAPTGDPLPEGVFPSWLERYIKTVADQIQVPASMVATICLSTLAACVMKKGIIRITPSWKEPLNLYTVVACPPSSRKTPTFIAVTEPLFRFESELQSYEKERVASAQLERNVLKMRIDRKMKDYSKTEGGPVPPEIIRDQLRMDELKDIEPTTLIMKDATPEVLSQMLTKNHERMAIMASEGKGVFAQMCGKYSKFADPGVYIDGYSGDPSKVHRIGRESERLESPTITLSLAVQPKIMRGVGLMDAAEQGLLARILYCFPEDNVGSRKVDYDPFHFDPTKLDYEIRQVYLNRLGKLLRLPLPEVRIGADGTRYDGMNVLAFDDDALKGFLEFEQSLEDARGREFDDEMREWLGKLGGNIARVIGLLHLAENIANFDKYDSAADVWKFPVMGHTVTAGVKLAEWYISHAVAAFEEMQSDPIKNFAIALVKWIRMKNLSTFYKSDAIQQLGGAAGDKTFFALTFLAERGYIRVVDPRSTEKNVQYETNPFVLAGDFHNLDGEDSNPNE